MEKRELICIGCPLGCPMSVTIDGDEITVKGNTCARGDAYAKKEILSPTRIVTSTVRVKGGAVAKVSVKTKTDIPKNKIFECMKEIRSTCVEAPVKIGDVIIADCGATGVDIIATKNVESV